MTDSRVTPQAVEAAERALIASTSPWPITDELWEKVKRTLGPNGTSSRREIELFLAAAAPLLCQPLQDEIDRLRAELDSLIEFTDKARTVLSARHAERDAWRKAAEYGWHLHNYGENAPGGTETWQEFERLIRAAAVPVGTGNPTQPRADG